MSSLIFYTDESQILVATDSLAVDENGYNTFKLGEFDDMNENKEAIFQNHTNQKS